MPGWLRGSGEGRSAEEQAHKRIDRLRERIGRIRADGIQAQMELQQRYRGPAGLSEAEIRRQAVQMLQDERTPRAAPPVRERAGKLWEDVEALRARPNPDERDIAQLEAALAHFEAQFAPLRAWFQAQAAGVLEPGDLSPGSRLRQELERSLVLDRDLLATPQLVIRCDFLTKSGMQAEALADAEAAARRPDAGFRVFAVLGAALQLCDRPLDAAAAYQRAYDANPQHDPDLLQKAGSSLLMASRHDEALAVATRLVDADPSNLKAQKLRADCLRFLGRFDEAEAAYRAVMAQPAHPDCDVALLQTLVGLGRATEAAELLQSIRDDPETTPHKLHLACYLSGRYREAARVLLSVLSDAGLAETARHQFERLMAASDCAMGCPDIALEELNASLAREPADSDLEDCRSIALAELGRFDEAIASSRRSKSLLDKSEYDSTLARALRWSGSAEDALPYARRSLEARPGRTEGICEVACCLLQLGRVDEAGVLIARLPEGDAEDPFVLYARAAAAISTDDVEARRLISIAEKIRPQFALRTVIDPVFHDGQVLDEGRRESLGSMIEANGRLRALAVNDPEPLLRQDDRVLLKMLAQYSNLKTPREIRHWLYFGDRRCADDAAAALRSDGLTVTVEPSAGKKRGQWCVLALGRSATLPATIASTRVSMERLASRLGGEYDGWEAEATPTESKPG